jgi:antirestriction protein ArdC
MIATERTGHRRAIFTAASHAQRAADFLNGFQQSAATQERAA